MSRICELIGDIDEAEPQLYLQHGDPAMGEDVERFYTIDLHALRVTIPLLVSEYRLDLIKKGRVKVTGALMSFYEKKQPPKFFFFVNGIEDASDSELTNTVSFIGEITKKRELTGDAAGRDVFSLVMSDVSPLNEVSLIFVAMRGKMARQYKDIAVHTRICGQGYLRPYKSTYEIYATEVDIL